MNIWGLDPSGQKKKRVPSSELTDIDHFPGEGKVMNPENTAPTLVTSALLAKEPVVDVKEMLGTVVLLLGRASNKGI
jgi:hypothetical protein